MDGLVCVDRLEDALRHHGGPHMFNSIMARSLPVTTCYRAKRKEVTIRIDSDGGTGQHLRRDMLARPYFNRNR